MKTYLVTGGAGFIGSNYIIYMLKKYDDIKIVNLDALTYAGNLENFKEVESNPRHIFVQGDICDKELGEKLFAEYDFDYVINFAAESHVDRSITNPEIFAQTNILGTVNLLNIAKNAWLIGNDEYKPGVKFLQVSTDEVYGALGETGFFTETTPLNPHSPYAASKASAQLLVQAYFDTFKMPVSITCCSNNYGPFQFPEKLIPLMINNTLLHKTLPIYGDGKQVRDWLYVDDHCKAIDMVTRDGEPGEVYNVGGHNERYNIDIVKTIIGYIKENVDDAVSEDLMRHVEDRKGHDRRYGIDPQKIKDDLGWYPETPFEKGIVLTIQWYLDHKDWMERVTSGAYQEYYEKMYKGR
jgi:dTDP-glucose 4,6-dehydratase